MYFVYVLECKDGSLYTGITTDVKRRFKEHRDGNGGHYTRAGRYRKWYTPNGTRTGRRLQKERLR